LRFALPSQYNDPYELFLQPSRPLPKRQRAFYKAFLGSLAEFPVTCFSRRPDSVAMWAHYARDGTGVCLGFDEDALTDAFPYANVGDVRYVATSAQIEAWEIDHAYKTGKNRHTQWLLNDAYGQAYFVKRLEWSYELERRIVVDRRSLRKSSAGFLARVPIQSLRYIIVGASADERIVRLCRRRATQHGLYLARFTVGKRAFEPFFVTDSTVLHWKDRAFVRCGSVCRQCGEPARVGSSGLCAWCSIDDHDKGSAALRSLWALAVHFRVQEPIVGFVGAQVKGAAVKSSRKVRAKRRRKRS
jgi:hypothetical protein